jgi:Na+/H+-dicarboxylate symporter
MGVFVVNLVKPGLTASYEQRLENRRDFEAWLHANERQSPDGKWLTDATAADASTVVDATLDAQIADVRSGDRGPLEFIHEMVPSNVFEALTDGSMLQIIVFAIFFGVILGFGESRSISFGGFVLWAIIGIGFYTLSERNR